MDTSQKYIKMCEKAEEIQELRSGEYPNTCWELGDYFALAYCYDVHISGSYEGFPDKICHRSFKMEDNLQKDIWLPRQDQLQEMVDTELWRKIYNFTLFTTQGDETKINMINYGYSWPENRPIGELPPINVDLFPSMEQLWLAFVMKEKYGKVWNGEEWITKSA